LAVFFALFIRNLNNDDDDEMTEHIDSAHHVSLMQNKEQYDRNKDTSIFISRSHTRANRLTKYEVEEARSRRLRNIQMWSIIREILSYLFFLWIIYAISYSNRNENAFRQVNHLRRFFMNIGHVNHDYTKVKYLDFFFLENFTTY
jgi:hypothetical protein